MRLYIIYAASHQLFFFADNLLRRFSQLQFQPNNIDYKRIWYNKRNKDFYQKQKLFCIKFTAWGEEFQLMHFNIHLCQIIIIWTYRGGLTSRFHSIFFGCFSWTDSILNLSEQPITKIEFSSELIFIYIYITSAALALTCLSVFKLNI